MADEADLAQDHIEKELSRSMARRRPSLVPTGQCFNCGEEVTGQACFCDADCRDDYERRARSSGLRG